MDLSCFECGKPSECDHHVVPKSRGGTKTIHNPHKGHGKAHHSSRNMSTSALTKAALARLKKQEKHIGGIPYGFDLDPNDKHSLVPIAEQQKTIKKINKLKAQGYSLRKIANKLSIAGIKTKKGSVNWVHTAVASIVNRS